jgi:hypothetical protein
MPHHTRFVAEPTVAPRPPRGGSSGPTAAELFNLHGMRRPEPDYHPDPALWLDSHVMTRTEVSLRLARWLLERRIAVGDVRVALTTYELTRRERPRFPVVRFLSERGFVRTVGDDDWRGDWRLKGATHALHLHTDGEDTGDVVASLAGDRRMVAFASRGVLDATRSPAEHKLLRNTIGRAATYEHAEPRDQLAAVVPRSARYRALAARWREAAGVMRARIAIMTVDRAGMVDGLTLDH